MLARITVSPRDSGVRKWMRVITQQQVGSRQTAVDINVFKIFKSICRKHLHIDLNILNMCVLTVCP